MECGDLSPLCFAAVDAARSLVYSARNFKVAIR